MSLDSETLGPAPSILRPVAALVGGILALSVGSSFAVRLFPLVGAEGTTALRAGFSALILAIVWRPWRRALTRPAAGAILVYGVALGIMNLLFYLSLRTIPFGIAVAIEFAGPLGVATLSSRRAVDLLWVGCAVLGAEPVAAARRRRWPPRPGRPALPPPRPASPGPRTSCAGSVPGGSGARTARRSAPPSRPWW